MHCGSGQAAGNAARERWNAKYAGGFGASFAAHPLAVRALGMTLPDGPVAELACGVSGSALLAAEAGRDVIAVDISDIALEVLAGEAQRRGLRNRLMLVQADLADWRVRPGCCALVLCTGYWDRNVFAAAAAGVTRGGVVGWEGLTAQARRRNPRLPAQWCLGEGEPAALLPAGFEVIDQHDMPGGSPPKRMMLARHTGSADAP
ncbi:MAG TPA: class I SAM-dependent methyltransferase [Streptosporangiaceae bacterium]|nr:class I SAM-dependent methyltransferase [Streptosporangiaceae bacterium]